MRVNHVSKEPFYVAIEFGQDKGFCVATGYFMSQWSVAKIKGPCVATKHFVS